MDFHKNSDQRLPSMFAVLKNRRILVLTCLAVVLLIAIFSQTMYHSDVTWDDVTQRIPSLGGGSSGTQKSCPACPKQSAATKSPGRFHYMIAASKPNKQFCRAIVSSSATRYGPPVVAGWHGQGELDAAKTHLAKVRAVSNYLNSLPAEKDNDLFMLIDGYDVQLQLGPEVLIERYYEVVKMEDERLIQQLGPTNAERIAGPLGRHVFFGADKICWPVDWRRPACWAVPLVPGMDHRMYGPKTNGGEMRYNKPRWLNSGTIMGPVKESRDFFQATMDMINATWTQEYQFRNSDQYYMAEVWGLQELERINAQLALDSGAWHPKGGNDAMWPKLEEGKRYNFHIAMDYWSHIFQTWAGYGEYIDWRKFDGAGFSRTIDQNVREEETFKKWDLRMEGDAIQSVDRIFRSTEDDALPETSDKLVKESEFGSNIVTKTTLSVFHCTGGKDPLNKFYPRMWFFKYARSLLRSAIAHLGGGEPYSPYPIDGRMWYPGKNYPDNVGPDDAGAWSDGSDGSGKMEWLGFDDMCKEFTEDIF